MKLLFDTHVLMALIGRRASSLPAAIAGFLTDGRNEHHLSAASFRRSQSSPGWAS